MPPANRKSPKTTAVLLDAELVEQVDKLAEERMIGRRLVVERFVRDGMARLTPPQLEPADGNGDGPEPTPSDD